MVQSLSLVSNAILYWNTLHISRVLDQLQLNGERIDPAALTHISYFPINMCFRMEPIVLMNSGDESSMTRFRCRAR